MKILKSSTPFLARIIYLFAKHLREGEMLRLTIDEYRCYCSIKEAK